MAWSRVTRHVLELLTLTALSSWLAPRANGSYATGIYWHLPDDTYHYSVTVWNNQPGDTYWWVWSVWLYTSGPALQVMDPPGWTHHDTDPTWVTYDPDAAMAPGEWLGGFDFVDNLLWERVYYLLRNPPRQSGYIYFELVPEPDAGFPLAAGVLGAAALIRRRIR
jgi:MYXO-CTERM domain-containing protein